jgi:hypothetical protein
VAIYAPYHKARRTAVHLRFSSKPPRLTFLPPSHPPPPPPPPIIFAFRFLVNLAGPSHSASPFSTHTYCHQLSPPPASRLPSSSSASGRFFSHCAPSSLCFQPILVSVSHEMRFSAFVGGRPEGEGRGGSGSTMECNGLGLLGRGSCYWGCWFMCGGGRARRTRRRGRLG